MNLGKDKIKNITKEEALLNKEIEVCFVGVWSVVQIIMQFELTFNH